MLHLLISSDMNFDLVRLLQTRRYVLIGLLLFPVWLYGTTRLLGHVYCYLYDSVDIAIAEMTVSLREEG